MVLSSPAWDVHPAIGAGGASGCGARLGGGGFGFQEHTTSWEQGCWGSLEGSSCNFLALPPQRGSARPPPPSAPTLWNLHGLSHAPAGSEAACRTEPLLIAALTWLF